MAHADGLMMVDIAGLEVKLLKLAASAKGEKSKKTCQKRHASDK